MGQDSTRTSDTFDATGDITIDGLLTGYKWAQDDGAETTTLTYSFPTSPDQYDGYGEGEEPSSSFLPLTDFQQAYFEGLLANLERVTNLEFEKLSGAQAGDAAVRVGWTDDGSDEVVAWAYIPEDAPWAGDVWLNASSFNPSSKKVSEYEVGVLMHEFGHALGLKHPHEEENGFGLLPDNLDGPEHTSMTYNTSAAFQNAYAADFYPQTYMWLDIQALQAMYGKDMVTTGGQDSYDFDLSTRHYLTIWDAGGTDSINVTGGDENLDIDLTPGSWSNIGTSVRYSMEVGPDKYQHKTLFIAPDTIIENASGADGNDIITGNDVANRLKGGGGDDKLYGGLGADSLVGGQGSDTLNGGDGDDQLFAGADDDGADIFFGGKGADVIGGGAGDDFLVGDMGSNASGSGNDILYGGAGDDTIIGGSWDDTAVRQNGLFNKGEALGGSAQNHDRIWAGDGDDLVYGSAGDDMLGGGTGDDTLDGGQGDDTIYGGDSGQASTSMNDFISGGAGDDLVLAGAGNDQIAGEAGADRLFGGADNDTIDGGHGDDSLWGGAGEDILSGASAADTFFFASGHGDDTITDFTVGEDILFLANATTDFKSLDDIQAATQLTTIDGQSGLLIDTGGGDSVFLIGLSMDDLSSIAIEL